MGSRSTRSDVAFPPGIHVPSLTWFCDDASQEIDWELQQKHLDFLIGSGLDGVTIAGTNGEAVTLSRSEKKRLVEMTVETASRLGRPDVAITMGTSGQCTRDVIAETQLAKEAGAHYVLVLTPSYFHFAMTNKAIVDFFEELADASPLPIVIYNFPNVVAGLDVNSDMLHQLAKHPNIKAVKLTCGGIAKVARLSAAYPPSEFAALAGQSDWLTAALSLGGSGVITGVANAFPKACMRIYDLHVREGKVEEAAREQKELAKMEWGFGLAGVNGTKWVVAKVLGYPEGCWHCRRPYPRFEDDGRREEVWGLIEPFVAVEKGIGKRDA